MPAPLVIGLAVAYLLLLFAVARFAERSRKSGATWIHHPLVYTLALGVHFTGWGYFASGASLFNQGLGDLYLAVGATLTFLVGWPLILKVIRISQEQRVTTLPELLTLRYGPSLALKLLVSFQLIAGTLFYLALQFAAVSRATHLLIVEPNVPSAPMTGMAGLLLAMAAAAFAILFGARRADPTERHEGIVVAVALDGIVKFVALGAVALLVIIQFPELFRAGAAWPTLEVASAANPYPASIAYLMIGMATAFLLPRMFHLTVVETVSERQIFLARWLFPLLLAFLTLFAALIAWAGARLGLVGSQLEGAPIWVPELAGMPSMAVLGYLGGISASASMMIVSLIALANLITTNLVLPPLSGMGARIAPWLRPIRWAIIVLLAILAWAVWSVIHLDYLNQYGFLAMIATALVAPAVLLGLLFPRLQGQPVIWGNALGLATWLYTGILPVIAEAMPALDSVMTSGPWGLAFLRPTAFLGLTGWDPYAHCFFWSITVNLAATFLLSLRMPASRVEEARVRSLLEGEVPIVPSEQQLRESLNPEDVQEFLSAFMGDERAEAEARSIQARIEDLALPGESKLLMIRNGLERVLRGPLGHDGASRIVQDRFPVTEQILPDVMEAFQELEESLQANQEELARRLRELSFLNEAAEILVTQTATPALTRAICRLIQEEFHLDHVAVLLIYGTSLSPACDHGFELSRTSLESVEGTAFDTALQRREIQLVRAEDPEAAADPLMRASGCREVAYIPIVFENELLGVLAIGVKAQTVHLSEAFLRVMGVMANELAIALSNAMLKDDLEDRVRLRTEELAQERDRLTKANEKLSKAIDELRNLDRVKGTFLNAVSHDLRIPLTGIMGYAEFLEDGVGGTLSAEQMDFAQQISQQAERMTGLLNELLDFARMEAGKFKVAPRPMSYPDVLNSAVNAFRPAMAKKQLDVAVALAPDLPLLQADPDRVIQILSNLLSNALKFTPEGGCIRVRAYPEGRMVVTEVSDTGVGIPPEDLPHMFERFYQSEAGKKAGGTGLGLSITKSLVAAHGGTIEASSSPGEGSTFRFTLPVADDEAQNQ
jgi:signal transduction histidine kinase/Na+/proline symporter